MANAKIDDNRNTAAIGVSTADGSTIVNVQINPSNGKVKLKRNK